MAILMRSTHANEIKFNTHVSWTLSFKSVTHKKLYLSSRVRKTNFFSFHKNRKLKKKRQRLNEIRLTLVYIRANAFRHVQSRAKSGSCFGSRAGRCTVREKNSFSILANLNTNFFPPDSKPRVHNTCVSNFTPFTCVERIKISNCL